MKPWAKLVVMMGVASLPGTAAFAAERLPAPGELDAIFEPFRTDQVAMAPDGKHLAYTVRDETRLSLVVADIDRPLSRMEWRVGQDAMTGFFLRRVLIRAEVNWLRWVSPSRLVYAVSVPNPDRNEMRDEVRTVDADGRNNRKVVDSFDVADLGPGGEIIPRRPVVLGIHPATVDAILVRAGSETFKVSLLAGKPESLDVQERPGRYLYDFQGRARIVEPPASNERAVARGRDALLDADAGAPELPPSAVFEKPPDAPTMDEPPVFDMSLNLRNRPTFDYGPPLPPSPIYWPQDFLYRPVRPANAVVKFAGFDWQKVDTFLSKEQALGFQVTTKNFYAQRSFPVAFDANPDILYFASNVGRDTYGLYALDFSTKHRTEFAIEEPHLDFADPDGEFADAALLFDRNRQLMGVRKAGPFGGARWIDPALGRMQEALDRAFAGRYVDIVDWDDAHHRAVALVFGPADPGRYFVVDDTKPARITEFFRRAPGLGADSLHRTYPFAFDTAGEVHLTGTITLPRRTRLTPPPLVLVCRDLPGHREWPAFNREVQALASMGFAVATVNYRGLSGFGTQHRDAVKAGYDKIPIEDLRATTTWLAGHFPINPNRVGLFGEGFGGFIALRAVQLFPAEFRCAVSINAPTDPEKWIYQPTRTGVRTLADLDFEVRKTFFDQKQLAALNLADHLAKDARPVFIIQDKEKRDLAESQGANLRNAMKRRGLEVEYLETTNDFTRGEPDARAKVFNQIAGFLNDTIYDYRVDLGQTKEVK